MKLLLLLSILIYNAYSQRIEGMISLEPLLSPAVDLIYNGKNILPEEAYELAIENKIDLADLNPEGDSAIWEDGKVDTVIDDVAIDESTQLTYEDLLVSRGGNFRFSVTNKSESTPRSYTFMASKKIHNVLLRKNLLRKLGYKIPAIKYIKKFKLEFKTKIEKKLFLASLKDETFASSKRWVVSEGKHYLILQDMIVMESDVHYYNLALGAITKNVVSGRRVLRSLLVPYSLLETPESINLFSWSAGRILANHLKLEHPLAHVFGTTIEDAKWIGRKIGSLTELDWAQIVNESHFPKEVSVLIKEKLIARRNDLLHLLSIEDEFNNFAYNSTISIGKYLVNGEIRKDSFEGYASRYSYGDPESPLSNSEIFSFIKSKLITTIISNGINQFNSLPFLSTDHDQRFLENVYKTFADAMLQSIKTGEVYKVPISAFAYPSYKGSVIFNRDIVAGSYLGTDNKVQLVDTIGVAMNVGGSFQVSGLPMYLQVKGGAGVNYIRSYAHIRPVISMKKALKYPFKNMVVPWFKKKLGKGLNALYSQEFSALDDEAKHVKVQEVVDDLGSKLEIGESILITDSIALAGNASLGIGLSSPANFLENALKAEVMGGAEKSIISRLHIMRANKNTYHIYKDLGNITRFSLAARLNVLTPILEIGTTRIKGKARIKFFKLELNTKKTNSNEDREKVIEKIRALREAFLTGRISKLKEVKKPYVIEHRIAENVHSAALTILKWKKIKSHTDMKVTHPRGHTKRFFRFYDAKMTGVDYEGLATTAISIISSMLVKQEIIIPYSNAANPGNSVFGKARNKVLSYEGEADENGKIKEPFIKLSYIYNGWKIKKKKALKILRKMRERYDFFFYPRTALNETKDIILYNINYNFIFYSKGLKNLLQITDAQVKTIFKKFKAKISKRNRKLPLSGLKRFLNLRRKHHKYMAQGGMTKYSKALLKMIKIAENNLKINGIVKLVGGNKNIYIYSKIEGFRNGDENGDKAYHSSSLGEFGSKEVLGPIESLRSKIGLSESEMLAYWLTTRAI